MRVDCQGEKEGEYLPRSRIQGGGVMLPHGWRVDPTRHPNVCVASTRAPDGWDMGQAEGYVIPLPFRPRLSDILPLLRESQETGQTPVSGGFVLRPVEQSIPSPRLDEGLPLIHIPEPEFRVVGVLGKALKDAAALLADPTRTTRQDWIKPQDVFELMTRATAGWLKKFPGVLHITSPDFLPGRVPIVTSERFDRAAQMVLKAFLRTENRAVLLKGVAGSGKTSLAYKIAGDFLDMKVPSRLQGHLMAALNVELFLPSRNSMEEMEKAMIRAEMAKRRIIWVIDEASRLVDRGGSTESLDTLLLFIDQGGKVILASDQSYLLEKREAFIRRLHRVYLPPAERQELIRIAASLSQYLGGITGVRMEPPAIRAAVDFSYALPFAQPHAAANLLSNTILECELRGEPEATPGAVEREVRAICLQGDAVGRTAETPEELVRMIRKEGFRGHETTLRELSVHLCRALSRRFRPQRPAGAAWACLLAGGPGVGKTMLARLAGKMISGSERKVLEIHGSAFQKEHSVQSLVGSPMSYVGYGEGGVLQNFVKQNPDGVLILKKPELGHPGILELLSEILQGSFTAGDGQMISTRGLFIFILTGAGCEAGKGRIGFGSEPRDQKQRARAALEEIFLPALASALGSIPVFRLAALEPSVLRNIFRLQVFHYGRARGIRVQVEEGVTEKIVSGFNAGVCGARGVLGQFRDLVEPVLEKEMESIGLKESQAQVKKLRLFLDPGSAVCCGAVPDSPDLRQGGEEIQEEESRNS
jgi:hypothetical protein